MKRISRRHASHREKLKLAGLAFQVHHGFEPVNLSFLAPVVALRYERHPAAKFLLSFLYVLPHGDFRDGEVGMLVAQPHPDAMRRVALLTRRLPVGFQHPLDCILQWTDLWLLPFVLLALWRDRARDCLTHHPSMHAMLLGQSLDRLSGSVAPPDLLE